MEGDLAHQNYNEDMGGGVGNFNDEGDDSQSSEEDLDVGQQPLIVDEVDEDGFEDEEE